jgi:hypothetical protein
MSRDESMGHHFMMSGSARGRAGAVAGRAGAVGEAEAPAGRVIGVARSPPKVDGRR